MKILDILLNAIDALNFIIGKVFSWLILFIMFVICYDVFMRYFLGKPTDWAGEVSEIMLLAVICAGGGAALLNNSHVRVNLVTDRLSPKNQTVLKLITYPAILLVSYIFITNGFVLAKGSFLLGSRTDTVFGPLIWPIQSLVPIAGFLLGIQVIADMARGLVFLATGKTMQSKWQSKQAGIH